MQVYQIKPLSSLDQLAQNRQDDIHQEMYLSQTAQFISAKLLQHRTVLKKTILVLRQKIIKHLPCKYIWWYNQTVVRRWWYQCSFFFFCFFFVPQFNYNVYKSLNTMMSLFFSVQNVNIRSFQSPLCSWSWGMGSDLGGGDSQEASGLQFVDPSIQDTNPWEIYLD